jgi:manganese-dependent inorganic pyrophosphatase
MNESVFVCGHKNPDTDSICAASVYAFLKNQIDNSKSYIPIRCGNINKQTKYVFEKSSIDVPILKHDIYPKVNSVARTDYPSLTPGDSILDAIRVLDEYNISVLPIVNCDKKFNGLISINEISSFLINDNRDHRPIYSFVTKNFQKVIPGFFYIHGVQHEFSASIMVGAMPFEVSIERVSSIPGGKPLLITGLRINLIEYAIAHNFPALVLTGCKKEDLSMDMFSSYEGSIFISETDTSETVRRLRLSIPVEKIMNSNPEIIEANTPFNVAKDTLVHSKYRGLPVMKNGTYHGIVSRRCFIEKPKSRLIMVDHNELEQSVNGANEAEICEIIDHHRLGSIRTKHPIFMDIRPVGSACTIVYDLYLKSKIELQREYALLLLSGILSDTVILRSPTTTHTDIRAAEELAALCEISISAFGEEIFSNTSSLRSDNYEELIKNDFKVYNEFGNGVGISQIEVITFQDLPDVENNLLTVMEEIRINMKLHWVLLLITNIIREDSILLSTDNERFENALGYPVINTHRYSLKNVLSRKKQLLPEVLRILEESV